MHISSSYGLSSTQFDSLFGVGDAEGVVAKSLDALKEAAAQGNADSIDMLHTVALRPDDIGRKAEQHLFDLFSGKTLGKCGVDQMIQQTSLKLYEAVQKASQRRPVDSSIVEMGFGKDKTPGKLNSPSRLLYMAGSAANASQRTEISQIFAQRAQSQSVHEAVGELDLWGGNRMVTKDELDAMLPDSQNGGRSCVSINAAMSLIDPVSDENKLVDIVSEKMMAEGKKFLAQPELFPVNTGNHWVLFCLYKDQDQVKAVVFNSAGKLGESTRNNLTEAAYLAGLNEKSPIEYVEENLQTHVPNGCGVLVGAAIKELASRQGNDPAAILRDFTQSFNQKSPTDQSAFNITQRRQIYEALI